MKVIKKMVVAVVVMAFCCSLALPVSAKAEVAESECIHRTSNLSIEAELSDETHYMEHDYYMSYHNGEEWIENARFTCKVYTIIQVYKISCDCGKSVSYAVRETPCHTDPNCPSR